MEAKPFDNNPRSITESRIQDLKIWHEKYGDLSGVVYNKRTNRIVSGNQRFFNVFHVEECEFELVHEYDEKDQQGTLAIGFVLWNGSRYAYRTVDWDEQTELEANIIANRAGADFDFEKLEILLPEEKLLDLGFEEWDFIEYRNKEQKDKIEMVNNLDEVDHWVGMPSFEKKPDTFKLIINFETEQDREDFMKKHPIKLRTQGRLSWSTIWPYQSGEDLKNVKYD